MTRRWRESDHPRDVQGQFTDKWAGRVSAAMMRVPVAGPVGQWREGSPRQAHQEMRQRLIDLVSDDPDVDPSNVEATLDKLLAVGQTVPTPHQVYESGPHRIVVATSAKVPIDKIQDVLADLQNTNPSRTPINLWVVPRHHMVIPHAAAETIRGTGFIRLADDAWDEREFRERVDNDPDYFMEQAQHNGPVEYFLTHEWGHVIDYDDAPGGDYKTQAHLKHQVSGDLSEYGFGLDPTNVHDVNEAYAEAFAEWFLSEGMTKNGAAQAYADMYQWRV